MPISDVNETVRFCFFFSAGSVGVARKWTSCLLLNSHRRKATKCSPDDAEHEFNSSLMCLTSWPYESESSCFATVIHCLGGNGDVWVDILSKFFFEHKLCITSTSEREREGLSDCRLGSQYVAID